MNPSATDVFVSTNEVSIGAQYGLRESVDPLAGGGTATATAAGGVFRVFGGNTFARIASVGTVRGVPGRRLAIEFDARFTAGPGGPNSLGLAGPLSKAEAIGPGRFEGRFGFFLSDPGVVPVWTLTITVPAGGAPETGQVVVGGAPAVPVAIGAGATTAQIATLIAAETFPGWQVTATGSEVVFVGAQAFATTDASGFSFTSSSNADGAFAENAVGVNNNPAAGFTPYNRFAGGPVLPDFDPAQMNTYRLLYSYGAFGSVELWVRTQGGEFALLHRQNATERVDAQFANPAYRLGIVATGGETVESSFFSGGVARPSARTPTDTFATSRDDFIADTTERIVLAVRSRLEFGNVENSRLVFGTFVSGASLANNRAVTFRGYIGGTPSAALSWSYRNKAESAAEVAVPVGGETLSGGREIFAFTSSAGAVVRAVNGAIQAGQVFYLTAKADGSTSGAPTTLEWFEFD